MTPQNQNREFNNTATNVPGNVLAINPNGFPTTIERIAFKLPSPVASITFNTTAKMLKLRFPESMQKMIYLLHPEHLPAF